MHAESPISHYLSEVLGISKTLMPTNTTFTLDQEDEEKVAVVFIAPQDLSKSEEQLLKKMALACPEQPVKILNVDPLLGKNEIENRLVTLAPQKALIFGEKLFQVIKGDEGNFFAFINQSFNFANAKTYASHELTDMCKGPNVNLLKKQVWQQMKQLSKT